MVRNTIFRKAPPSVVSGYGKRSINLNKVVATFEEHIFLSQTDLTRIGIISNSYNEMFEAPHYLDVDTIFGDLGVNVYIRNTIFRKALPSVVSGYGKRSINLNKLQLKHKHSLFTLQTFHYNNY